MKQRKLEAITDRIFLVKGKNKGRFPYSHSVLILDKENALVDTGCGIETLKKIRKEYEVKYAINSHTHPDHSAGKRLVDKRFSDRPSIGADRRSGCRRF